MIARRGLLAGTAALLAFPRFAAAALPRLAFTGSLEQGSLVVGAAQAGARVTLDGTRLDVAPAGAFVFGFAYDRTKPATVAATFEDGTTAARVLDPIVRKYEIQRINGLPEQYVTLPPEILARRRREVAMIVAARERDTDADWFREPLDWPLRGIVSGLFGSQRILNGTPMAPHFGIDIAAPAGSPILAPAPAEVALAEPDFYLEGGLTILDHGHGVSTCYLHQRRQLVKSGGRVARGQAIGEVGMTGRATGPHLHWGLNWFQLRLDPSRSTRTPWPARA